MQDIMPPIDTSDNSFKEGNPFTGELGTKVTALFLNNIQSSIINLQDEMVSILEEAGFTPDPSDTAQILSAIKQIINSNPSPVSFDLPGSEQVENPYFGPSGVISIAKNTGYMAGEPFIVYDNTNSVYVMYYFRTLSSPVIGCFYSTSTSLEGSWSGETQVTSLNNYHKFAFLVNDSGEPVKVGGLYYGYAVYYNGSLSDKVIHAFSSPSLYGAWTDLGPVVPKGSSGSADDFFTDAPYALYDDGTVYLWYMGAPSTSLTYGLAEQLFLTTSSNPGSGFTKQGVVLSPAIIAGWDYGWIGGVQVRKINSGKYVMLYNAGSTRPLTVGDEPAASAIGLAVSDSLIGVWNKQKKVNPIATVSNVTSTAAESTNIWRGHLSYDQVIGKWYLFYNTGVAGSESITFARSSEYSYQYAPNFSTNGGNVQFVTTTKTEVINSRVNLTPGTYLVKYTFNLIADSYNGTTPKLDIDSFIQKNQVDISSTQTRAYVGNYAYENFDVETYAIIQFTVNGYVDLTIKVNAGTPVNAGVNGGTLLRNLRVSAIKI